MLTYSMSMLEQLKPVFGRICEIRTDVFDVFVKSVLSPKELGFYLHGKKRVKKKYRNIALRRIELKEDG